MTKQLFAQLDDLAAEQVVGGGTFYTAKGVQPVYDGETLAGFTWGGEWNELSSNSQGSAKGKGSSAGQKITNGDSNNLYDSKSIDVNSNPDDGQQIYYWYEGTRYTITATPE